MSFKLWTLILAAVLVEAYRPPPFNPDAITIKQPRFKGDIDYVDISVSCKDFYHSSDRYTHGDFKASIFLDRPVPYHDITEESKEASDGNHPEFLPKLRFPFSMSENAQAKLTVIDVNSGRISEEVFKAKFAMIDLVAAMHSEQPIWLKNDHRGDSSTCSVTASPAVDGELLLIDMKVKDFQDAWTYEAKSTCRIDSESGPRVLIEAPLKDTGKYFLIYESEDFDIDSKRVRDNPDKLEYKQFGLYSSDLSDARNDRKMFRIRVVCKPAAKNSRQVELVRTEDLSVSSLLEGGFKLENTFPFKNSPAKFIVSAEKASKFGEYLRNGLQFRMHMAVDFTGSNALEGRYDGHFLHDEPHYLESGIRVFESLAPLAINKEIDLYEFGGKNTYGKRYGENTLKPLCDYRHRCDPHVTGKGPNVIQDVQQFEAVYEDALKEYGAGRYFNNARTRNLGGETNFSPIINAIAADAKRSKESRYPVYHVLTILTDGAISLTDKQNTIDAIVRASDLPMSIVIVGIGLADFTQMEELDGDDEPMLRDSRGNRAKRDIVNFVPYRDYIKINGRIQYFSKELLSEVPLNVVQYFHKEKVSPNALSNWKKYERVLVEDESEAIMGQMHNSDAVMPPQSQNGYAPPQPQYSASPQQPPNYQGTGYAAPNPGVPQRQQYDPGVSQDSCCTIS